MVEERGYKRREVQFYGMALVVARKVTAAIKLSLPIMLIALN